MFFHEKNVLKRKGDADNGTIRHIEGMRQAPIMSQYNKKEDQQRKNFPLGCSNQSKKGERL